jgi:hypothetical protein
MLREVPITIALDPTSDGFAFVLLQGSETLLDWGCSEVDKKRVEKWRARVGKLISRYDPGLLVLEDMDEPRRGAWAHQFVREVETFARSQGMDVQRISRPSVREFFAASGKTKYDIAVALSRLFPELAPRLPRKRKPWMSEDKRMSIFDALACALVAIRPEATGSDIVDVK